jgi:hypothetical protein
MTVEQRGRKAAACKAYKARQKASKISKHENHNKVTYIDDGEIPSTSATIVVPPKDNIETLDKHTRGTSTNSYECYLQSLQSQKNAERLDALWNIANDDTLETSTMRSGKWTCFYRSNTYAVLWQTRCLDSSIRFAI